MQSFSCVTVQKCRITSPWSPQCPDRDSVDKGRGLLEKAVVGITRSNFNAGIRYNSDFLKNPIIGTNFLLGHESHSCQGHLPPMMHEFPVHIIDMGFD